MDIKVPAGSGGGGGRGGGNRDGGNQNKRASRDNRNQPQGQANDDDWSTVTSRSGRSENYKSFDVQKLQKTRDADNISLGPSRAGWGKGSGSGFAGSKPQNRFAAAANLDVGPGQAGGGPGQPGDNSAANQNRYQQSSQSMGANFNRNNSRNEARQEALDFARNRFGNQSNGPTNNVMGPSPTPKDAQPGPQQVR